MNRKDKKPLKKYVAAFLAILIAITMVFSVAAPIFTMMAYGAWGDTKGFGTDAFTIEAEVGFDNKYMLDNTMPFRFNVTNHGEDFSGELQLKVQLNQNVESREGDYALYYVPVVLAENATEVYTMDIPMTAEQSFFTVMMESTAGTVVYQQEFLALPQASESVWIGILTEHPEHLSYLKESFSKVTEYGAPKQEVFFLDAQTLSENVSVLQNFRLIIMNDFDTQTLSSTQIKALKAWVESGGLLVLGTGANAHKVLGGLGDLETFIYHMETAVYMKEGTFFVLSDSVMADGIPLAEENGIGFSVYKNLGHGSIVLHQFDLAKEGMPQNINLAESLSRIYQQAQQNVFIPQYNYYDTGNNIFYRAENLSRGVAPVKGKDITLIYGIIGGYILLLGPILYLLLKKMDKRERGWVVIPLLSVIVTAVVYSIGLGSYYRGNLINVVTLMDLTYGEPTAQAQMFMGIKSSDKGDLQFYSEDDIRLDMEKLADGYSYYYAQNSSEKLLVKANAEGTAQVTFYDQESWNSNILSAHKTVDMGGTLDGELAIEDTEIFGTITNNTRYDMEDVILSYGTRFFGVGDLKAGETLDIHIENADALYSGGDYYYSNDWELEEILGIDGYYYGGLRWIDEEDLLAHYVGYNRYQLIMGNHGQKMNSMNAFGQNALTSIKLYAFNNQQPVLEGIKHLNGKVMKEQQETLFTLDLPLTVSKDKSFKIPFGFVKPLDIFGENGGYVDYYPEDNYMNAYDYSTLFANFALPSDMNVTAFELKWESKSDSAVKGEIYNYEADIWESIPLPCKFGEDAEKEFSPYVSPAGWVTLKGTFDAGDAYIPEISLKGGVN